MDERDAFNALRRRITWQALLVQHALETSDHNADLMMTDDDLVLLNEGLIELCASIVKDTHAMRKLVDAAEKGTGGAR